MNDFNRHGVVPVESGGFRFRVWATEADELTLIIFPQGSGESQRFHPQSHGEGWHEIVLPEVKAGDGYCYEIDGRGPFPDPASRSQREDVHGPSLVVDARTFPWSDQNWIRPPFRDLVIYELHIGTFTEEGTFRAACSKFAYLKELGVTAMEIMPLADFPGGRNWGYDGVLPYAPARCYGSPDDLRSLVDCAHAHGLAVILDVVYNHLGPDGNYLSQFSPFYFNDRHHTPWGSAINFDGRHSGPVRNFFGSNPVYWMEDFHIDGFRFDAVHEIYDDSSRHILREMTDSIHERGGYALAEDPRNLADLVRRDIESGLGFDSVWADDFHHCVRVMQTGEEHAYFADFQGTPSELVDVLDHGWAFRGRHSVVSNGPRGTPCRHLPPCIFLYCISNHDQVGNRACGERLHSLMDPQAYRALSMLLCLSPCTPMLFMGQEWGATSPFLYFTDHETKLGRKVTEGRRKEFAGFPEFSDSEALQKIPDPQGLETFQNSKLAWKDLDNPHHRSLRNLYADCLQLRRRESVFRPDARDSFQVKLLGEKTLMLTYGHKEKTFVLLFNPKENSSGTCPGEGPWTIVLSSEDPGYGGEGKTEFDTNSGKYQFRGPAALLLRAAD